MKVTDNDIIDVIESRSPATAAMVDEHFGMSRQAARRRCESLVEQGRLTKHDLGGDTAFILSAGHSEIASDNLEAKVRELEDGLAVDVEPCVEMPIQAIDSVAGADDTTLLVQGHPGGYKFDTWWILEDTDASDTTRHSCVHFEFGNQPKAYAYDNTHRRDVGLHIGDGHNAIIINDSEVRAHGVGYDGATIQIDTGENGFEITVSWTDECGEENTRTITAPLIDPRRNKEAVHKIVEENYETLYPDFSD